MNDNYLKDNIKRCVDYAMKQDDDGKRRILTGLFEYCDRLVNEDILVTCLNDEQKREWLHNELIDNLQARIDKAIEYIEKNWIEYSDFQYVDNDDELNVDCESIKELFDILKGSDKE